MKWIPMIFVLKYFRLHGFGNGFGNKKIFNSINVMT